MHILLFGASGHVGTGLAQRLSSHHTVTGIVRRRPETQTAYAPVTVPEWVDEPEAVLTALAAANLPSVDAVIAAVGGWYVDEPVLERGLAKFDEDYDSYLRGHFAACHISERLAAERSEPGRSEPGQPGTDHSAAAPSRVVHLALNGVASVEALAGSGAISVFGAAQKMLIEVAAAESSSVDFRELRIMAPVGGDDRNDLTGGVETVALAEVAEAITAILDSPERFDVNTEIHPTASA
ncbi:MULTISPECIES: NAD(P)-dependent oxidoreductase [unclassified Brevibacterium]|uniref:NAD(P)-dependent oxidoreductase n=1 Tax=unclassified Brevibacterium TaxID=2614124 RepID=UPI001091D75F|nr:NAD(P)-dependent oxidoreductase [Brevibacterium sp. S22]TGD30557.1 NAD(P)-dependent oxidoreductase [Brevibacterium sp. S22]